MEKESKVPCGYAAWEKQGLEGIVTLTNDPLATYEIHGRKTSKKGSRK